MKYKYRLDKKIFRLLVYFRSLFWYKKPINSLNLYDMDSIAIVYPHLIGDIVMATPFFRMLRQVSPKAKITFIGAIWAKDILSSQNLVDEFICFRNSRAMLGGKAIIKNLKDIFSILKIVRKKQFDIAIEPFGAPSTILFMSFMKAKQYVGMDFSNLHKLQTFTVPYDPQAHLVTGLMKLFECLGIRLVAQNYYPSMLLSVEQQEIGKKFIEKHFLSSKIIIGIHPGASVPGRRWKGFAQTINLLLNTYPNMAICLFCGPDDGQFVQDIISNVDERFRNSVITVKRNIKEYLAILGICTHIICNDSSCGHLSAALKIPVTILFAQGDPKFIAPRAESVVNILSKDFPCKPCLSNICYKNTHECFSWITPEMVFDTVQQSIVGDRLC